MEIVCFFVGDHWRSLKNAERKVERENKKSKKVNDDDGGGGKEWGGGGGRLKNSKSQFVAMIKYDEKGFEKGLRFRKKAYIDDDGVVLKYFRSSVT